MRKRLIKLICTLGTTKWRPPQWPGQHHKSTPKSVCTFRKHLSRKPNIQHSQSSNSALAAYLILENRTCSVYKEIPDLLINHTLFPHCLFNRSVKVALAPNPCLGGTVPLQSMDCFPLNKGHQVHY